MYSLIMVACALASNADPSADARAELFEKALSAIDNGQMEVLESILEQQPELGRVFDRRKSLLGRAIYSMSKPAVEVLLAHGADVNMIEAAALTPLHGAARVPWNPSERDPKNMLEIAQLLISHKADLNAQYKYEPDLLPRIPDRRPWSSTPLDIAATAGYVDLVKLLLKHGAKLHAPHGKVSPLHWACGGHYDTEHSTRIRSPGNWKMIALLVEKGADINGTDHLNETPLILLRAGCSWHVRGSWRRISITHRAWAQTTTCPG